MSTDHVTPEQFIDTLEFLTRAISADSSATVWSLPRVGGEQTLILSAPNGTGRLLGKGGETFRALQRVASALAWRTGISFRLVIDDPRAAGVFGEKCEQQKAICEPE